VRYYRMTAGGEPEPRNEVDEVRWVPLAEAAELLSYPHDRELLGGLG
jgi:8-oxo-(d)GTP phosphatase